PVVARRCAAGTASRAAPLQAAHRRCAPAAPPGRRSGPAARARVQLEPDREFMGGAGSGATIAGKPGEGLPMQKSLCLALLTLGAAGSAAAAPAPGAADARAAAARGVMNQIADAGFNHSEIPETAEYLDDQIGGRMTNSPAMRRAERWTAERLRGWGLR